MHVSRPTRARILFATTVLMYVVTLGLGVVNIVGHAPEERGDFIFTAIFGLGLLAVATLGCLVAVRRPENPVGWILLLGSAVLTLPGLGGEYAVLALYTHPGPPGGALGAWSTEWLFVPGLFMLPALLLLEFPDGRLPGRLWRLATWLCLGAGAVYLVATILLPGEVEDSPFKGLPNPLGVAALEDVARVVSNLALICLALSVVLGAASMIVRLRRSSGVQRTQLKWVAASAALFAVACVAGVVTVVVIGSLAGAVMVVLTFLLLPFTAGVVILRHRLYDVDVVIRRTLIYGPVTATLLAVYVGLVLVLGAVLQPLANGSDLVVAISTLAVAALFGPVRRRAQAVVDRRFYRRRYDAELTIDRFASDLRVNTDLEAVGDALTDAVHETVQPSHVSLWLRPQAR